MVLFRELWLFNNSKRIKLLSSATSACLNFTMPSWLEKLEHMDSYATDPPWHSCCSEKAQETKLFPNSLREPIYLTDKKNARLWVFGLATGNEDLTSDPEAAAARQQLCRLCAARGCVHGATGDSPSRCDKWNLQCCPATLHINCVLSPCTGTCRLGRRCMTLNDLYNLYSRKSLYFRSHVHLVGFRDHVINLEGQRSNSKPRIHK